MTNDAYTYAQYIGNLATLAVDVANYQTADGLPGISGSLIEDHGIKPPTPSEMATLLPLLQAALRAVTTRETDPVNELLTAYPPDLHISTHGGLGPAHLHHARDGEHGVTWIGRSCAAALAHIACDVPDVAIGQCGAEACGKYFVDQSRNRSRKFCSNTCASRTTVAAHRARKRS
ncbi:CGNR zinc finger domain-containing protein [Catelliglobosispora koreensis]|uniref:CGNR zinc finger domain-containing protein n=1 Tax=Catelliglobosispora koreensis TaxID=129052 RepID=UPI000374F2ED|nr:CGNR zinc finger domain-containing protein [Catelliglobosispora koreensis]